SADRTVSRLLLLAPHASPSRRSLTPVFFSILRPPPTSTLFPYTTLFRSLVARETAAAERETELEARERLLADAAAQQSRVDTRLDRKSTRLNSSHVSISYAVFCLKKKKRQYVCRPRNKTCVDLRASPGSA